VALYLEHFGLSEAPFRITPHTDFFFDGADRGATLEALVYAVLHDEGIVKVSGEVGSGKTMLSRVLMERLPAHVETIYLATPSLGKDEILHAIGDELDLRIQDARMTVALRALQEHLIGLYAAGRRVVILVDEAHVMPDETLEQVRLLSNLESSRHKLLQIVLFGQPELDATLAKPSLRQLRDRITHAFRMRPLSEPEVAKYLSFRMRAAAYRGPDVFGARAIALLTRASSGLTRRINILADKSLLSAFTRNTHAVTDREVRAAIADSEFARPRTDRRPLATVGAAIGAALAVGIAGGALAAWMLAKDTYSIQSTAPMAVAAPPPAPQAPEVPPPKPEVPPQNPELAEVAKEPEPAPDPAPRLDAEQLRRLAGYSPAGQPLLAKRLEATRDLLQRAPDEAFAIELFITENTDAARMERFLLRARDLVPLEELYVIPMAAAGEYRLWVVYGAFETRAAASAAQTRLPPRYQNAFRTAPRSFSELREQI
jgi:type II secretory pathway predicted ATPase ExeA